MNSTEVRAIRGAMSRPQFAALLCVSAEAVKAWEYEKAIVPRAMALLIRLVMDNPEKARKLAQEA